LHNILKLKSLRGAALLVAMFSQTWALGASYDVPLHDPVYRYIDMLPLGGIAGGVNLSSRPYTEAQVCSVLVYAERNLPKCDTTLNRFYLRQFQRTADGSPVWNHPKTISFHGMKVYGYPYLYSSLASQDSGFSIAGFNAASVDSISTKNEIYNKTGVGGRLFASVGSFLMYFDGTIITEFGSQHEWMKTNDPQHGRNYATIMAERNKPGHLIGYDDFRSYVKIPVPWFDLKAGNDRVSWGYADSSGLFFSGIGKPFLHMKIDKTFGKLSYSFLIGKLIGDTYEQRRIIYAKHITYTPWQWLSMGLSDGVISWRKGLEPLYFLPIVPFYFTEHYLGSPDNRIMSIDGTVLFGHSIAAYGEFFLDDISNMLGMFTNTETGDKWAGLIGVKVFNFLPRIPASVLRAQIVNIEPWVYTTSSAPGDSTANYPMHFGSVLGNRLGPHSKEFSLDFSCQLSRMFGGGIGVRRIWHGKWPSGPGSPGSSVFDRNPYVLDTIEGVLYPHQEFQTKLDRFEQLDRLRNVFSAQFSAFPFEWLSVNLSGAIAQESEPKQFSLYNYGIDIKMNY
jgi:hypothetical protein